MLLVPIYFLITYGAYSLFCSIYTITVTRLGLLSGIICRVCFPCMSYQVNHYFHCEKDTLFGGRDDAAMVMYDDF